MKSDKILTILAEILAELRMLGNKPDRITTAEAEKLFSCKRGTLYAVARSFPEVRPQLGGTRNRYWSRNALDAAFRARGLLKENATK